MAAPLRRPKSSLAAVPAAVAPAPTLILGLGNTLLGDDGIGVLVVRALAREEHLAGQEEAGWGERVVLRDGGTIGLGLLVEIEAASALIAIDAAEMGVRPGEVRVFEGAEMERMLSGPKRTAHEVALADLIAAAKLTGREPRRKALIGIQPASTGWGLEPSAAVNAAIPSASAAVRRLLARWGVA